MSGIVIEVLSPLNILPGEKLTKFTTDGTDANNLHNIPPHSIEVVNENLFGSPPTLDVAIDIHPTDSATGDLSEHSIPISLEIEGVTNDKDHDADALTIDFTQGGTVEDFIIEGVSREAERMDMDIVKRAKTLKIQEKFNKASLAMTVSGAAGFVAILAVKGPEKPSTFENLIAGSTGMIFFVGVLTGVMSLLENFTNRSIRSDLQNVIDAREALSGTLLEIENNKIHPQSVIVR